MGSQPNNQGTQVNISSLLMPLCFVDCERSQLQSLKDILTIFSTCSVSQINFDKSALFQIFGDEDAQWAAGLLDCNVGSLPATHLGLPLGAKSGNLGTSYPEGVAEVGKLEEQTAEKWEELTYKSALSSLPVNFMSLFIVSVTVSNKLDKIFRKFLWSGTTKKMKIRTVDMCVYTYLCESSRVERV